MKTNWQIASLEAKKIVIYGNSCIQINYFLSIRCIPNYLQNLDCFVQSASINVYTYYRKQVLQNRLAWQGFFSFSALMHLIRIAKNRTTMKHYLAIYTALNTLAPTCKNALSTNRCCHCKQMHPMEQNRIKESFSTRIYQSGHICGQIMISCIPRYYLNINSNHISGLVE